MVAIALAIAPAAAAWAQSASVRVIEVRVEGRVDPEGREVTAVTATGRAPEPRRLRPGSELPAGMEIWVPGLIGLVVETANGTRIELHAGARFKVGAVTDRGELYAVGAGSATFHVSRALGFFNVEFRRFVALVRGTSFTVDVDDTGGAFAGVLRGRVLVQREVFVDVAGATGSAEVLEVQELDPQRTAQQRWPPAAPEDARRFTSFVAAERHFRAALTAAEASQDYDALQVARNNLGLLLMTWGDPRQASPLFQRCLDAADARRDDPWRARALNNLGAARHVTGQPAAAIAALQQALSTNMALAPDGTSTRIAQNQNNLGLAYRKAGDPARGMAWLEAALETNRRLSPSGVSPAIAKNLDNLGNATVDQDPVRAERYYEDARRMREQLYGGAPHPDLASSYHNLGNLHSRRGDAARAIELHERALGMRRTLYTDRPHPSVADSLASLGNAYCRAGSPKEGIERHDEALALRLSLHPSGVDPSIAESHRQLAGCWARATHDPAAAEEARRHARLAREIEAKLWKR